MIAITYICTFRVSNAANNLSNNLRGYSEQFTTPIFPNLPKINICMIMPHSEILSRNSTTKAIIQ